MQGSASHRSRAFTLIELLVIGVVVLMLALLLPQALANRKQKVRRNRCSKNLRDVGIAFKTYVLDGYQYPMRVEAKDGGSLEEVATGRVFAHFQIMSNELMAPKVLVCPSDVRSPARDFRAGLSNTNLSYFVGVDADDPFAEMFLAGDRNVTNGPLSPNHILVLKTNSLAGWTHELHRRAGNVLVVDGSVLPVDDRLLRNSLERSGVTNRLAIP